MLYVGVDLNFVGDVLLQRHVDIFSCHDWPIRASVFLLSAETHGVRRRVVTLPLVVWPDLNVIANLKCLEALHCLLVDFDLKECHFLIVGQSLDCTSPKSRQQVGCKTHDCSQSVSTSQ